MDEEYKKKLIAQYEYLQKTVITVAEIIDLLENANTLNLDTKAKTTAFLEGYMTGLKEQVEWLNITIP